MTTLVAAALIGQAYAHAQKTGETTVSAQEKGSSPASGIEKLNMVGAEIRMPPFADTILGTDSGFRRALYHQGFALRTNSTVSYTQNLLDPPVAVDKQVYVGERQSGKLMANPILTYDLRAFHLRNAQLNIAAGLNWVNWNQAGPRAITMSSLYLYKAFANSHVETKIGYISNDFEFVGLQVGGALSTGSQGVYAILPYEVGLSHFPLVAPSFNLTLNGPKHVYFRGAIQRSLDAGGGVKTIERNATGFRFMPKGDKMVNIYEVGYRQRATSTSGQTWLRAGYIRNTTPYPNSRTGGFTSGNLCMFALADRQFTQSDSMRVNNGIYAGVSAIGTSSDLNAYTRYYELRLYDEGPFHSRPGDTASLACIIHEPLRRVGLWRD